MGTTEDRVHVVVVTVTASPELLPELEVHAKYGLQRFPEFSGFLFGALQHSEDGTQFVQYLQWSTEAEYSACINDASWDEVPTSRRFMELLQSGDATMDVRAYSLVDTAGVPGPV